MRFPVRWLTPLLVLSGALPAALPAAAAAAPELAGTTTVTGSASASMLVTLPADTPFHAWNDVSLSGSGRLSGVVLKRTGAWDAPAVVAIGAGFCGTRGCAPAFPGDKHAGIHAPGGDGVSGVLPAGSYRLYLVADGGPVTATLRFAGLPGQVALTPTSATGAPRVVEGTPTVAEPAGSPSLFAGGSTATLAAGGLNFTALWKDLPVPTQPSAVGLCLYAGPPPASDGPAGFGDAVSPAYQAPCDGGDGQFPPFVSRAAGTGDAGPTPVGPGRNISAITSWWLLPPGEVSIGGYHDTPGPVTAAFVHQGWLAF